MERPQTCSVCHQSLRRIWHPVAHGTHYEARAEIWTCPHNILNADHFAAPRHDEWHQHEHGWVKRES